MRLNQVLGCSSAGHWSGGGIAVGERVSACRAVMACGAMGAHALMFVMLALASYIHAVPCLHAGTGAMPMARACVRAHCQCRMFLSSFSYRTACATADSDAGIGARAGTTVARPGSGATYVALPSSGAEECWFTFFVHFVEVDGGVCRSMNRTAARVLVFTSK